MGGVCGPVGKKAEGYAFIWRGKEKRVHASGRCGKEGCALFFKEEKGLCSREAEGSISTDCRGMRGPGEKEGGRGVFGGDPAFVIANRKARVLLFKPRRGKKDGGM